MAAAISAPKVLPLLKAGKPAAASPGGPAARSGAPRPGGGSSGAPLHVTTVTVKPVLYAETVTATGSLRAEEGVELQAEVSGKIVAINFREGTRVKEGDLLLKINDADLRATLSRATSRKQLADLKERRLAVLLKDGGVRQEDYDTAVNEVNVQKAEMELTQAQIAKTEIRAPFDGVIGLRFVSEGAFITATANNTVRIATLQAIDHLKIDFSLPEKYAFRLRAGSPITFTVAGGDQRYSGEIYAFEPRIDVATRTVLVRALCPNEGARLLPGAFANVEMTLAQIEDAILVPSVAVVPGLNEKNVFVVEDGKAVRRPVETGTRTETAVQILAGLKPGDVVITSGIQQLRAGLPVATAGGEGGAKPGGMPATPADANSGLRAAAKKSIAATE